MKNFIKDGDTLTFSADATIAAGVGFLLGSTGLFGVNSYDVDSGDSGEARIKGVFNLPKASADTPGQFANAYWDDTAKNVTTTVSGNTLIGVFAEAYGNGDTAADVKLIPNIA